MVAAAMEKKRLGLCSKTLVAVPNHLTGQFASEALKLYPNANILVTTQRDFEKSNRKRFCGKIATGNYDIVVIGHSQFEKIPLSDARKAEFIRKQIDELEMQLESMDNSDSRLTVKQLESKKKQLKTKLSNLLDAPKRDDVVTFEELGADSLMVDEAHNFKNLMTVTKMHNIAGISTTESQKASDLFMKCQYLDEITGARGVTFATGTPISNSMTELYTMQRYLQQYTLERNGLANFDSWAATFGETVTAIELAPEGTGYRTKTRFARFFNLPELIAMFKECADIQTADMLKLPVPALVGGKPTNIQLKPSEIQKQMVAELGERADKIRNKMVKPYEDNMLKITNDGRKLALDQRLIDPDLPDDPDSKVNICVGKIFEIWEQTMPQRSAQLVFCDLSTPKAGVFNVYDDMKAKLIERGIPETEIAFIHEANTDARKTELFGKVRSGAVRVLMGSTAKMGAGTNVQQRLVALHHLDVPWRPSDIEQREGRINRFECLAIRQNIAKRYGTVSFKKNIWKEMFDEAAKVVNGGEGSDLIPFWGLTEKEDMVRIERIVPMYPFSRDELAYERLIKILSLYRLTLGQARQEELLEYIFKNCDDLDEMKNYFINLSPYYKKH